MRRKKITDQKVPLLKMKAFFICDYANILDEKLSVSAISFIEGSESEGNPIVPINNN